MNLRDLENRLFGGVKDARADEVTRREIRPWSTAELAGHKYCLLTTYRKDGTPVNTPVWFGLEDERVYVRSGGQDGKVKRIRRNSEVLVAPCTARGGPLGDPMAGRARFLAAVQCGAAEAAIRANYGLGRRFYRLTRRRLDVAYIEVVEREGTGGAGSG